MLLVLKYFAYHGVLLGVFYKIMPSFNAMMSYTLNWNLRIKTNSCKDFFRKLWILTHSVMVVSY